MSDPVNLTEVNMSVKCPYDELTLKIALISITEEQYALLEKAPANFNIPQSKVELNKAVADRNGMPMLDLLQSPNYTILMEEYSTFQVHNLIEDLEKRGFTNKQAWGILAVIEGSVKD